MDGWLQRTVRSRDVEQTPLDIFNRVFGYADFRGAQQEIVHHVSGGGDALVLMPTGGGKSLCYHQSSVGP